MYRRDFGLCLKDYFSLTGFPPLIPRYALGIWWNRDMIYSYEDTKNLIKSFHKYEIPISVLLLNEFWHKKDKKLRCQKNYQQRSHQIQQQICKDFLV